MGCLFSPVPPDGCHYLGRHFCLDRLGSTIPFQWSPSLPYPDPALSPPSVPACFPASPAPAPLPHSWDQLIISSFNEYFFCSKEQGKDKCTVSLSKVIYCLQRFDPVGSQGIYSFYSNGVGAGGIRVASDSFPGTFVLRWHVSRGQPQLSVQNGDKAQGMLGGKGGDSGQGSDADLQQIRSKVSGCLGIRDGMRAQCWTLNKTAAAYPDQPAAG